MKIGVVGSINIDLVVKTHRIPKKGETLMGESISNFSGGKGANQAVAISRLGGEVTMFGCVGNDHYGEYLLNNLKLEKVDVSHVKEIEGVNSGMAIITVGENDNSIVVISSANDCVNKEYIDSVKNNILSQDLIIVQNEIPMETIEYLADICYENKVELILNPAPAKEISKDLISKVAYITPNEHETKLIFKSDDIEKILKEHSEKLIMTEGEKGVKVALNSSEVVSIPCRKSKVVDTTGAGDTFNGAFCVGLTSGKTLVESIRFANIAAGLSTEKFGAQSGMPYLNDVLSELGGDNEN